MESEYLYNVEELRSYFLFSFSDSNQNGYFELFGGYFTNPGKLIATPGLEDEGLFYEIVTGRYNLEMNKDFKIINMLDRKYLYLKSDDNTICLLIPLNQTEQGWWWTFWGISRFLWEEGIAIVAPYSEGIQTSSVYKKEEINNQEIIYKPIYSPSYITRNSMWVEGNAEYGEGEYLLFNLTDTRIGLIILNGFIVPWNLDLYYQNSRPKIILIEYDDVRETVILHDTPNPQIINFVKDVKTSIKITIQEVYQGTKYKDSAITNILFLMKPTRQQSVIRDHVKKE
jgi:hypothetical protein